MNYISSLDNKYFKEASALRSKKGRYTSKSYLIEGIRFLKEAIKNKLDIKYVIISESKKDYVLKNITLDDSINVMIFSEGLFSKIKGTENSQGVIASIKMKEDNYKFNFNEGIYFLIDKVQDPGNLGTIIRTAVAVNALGVILVKGCVDVYNEKVLRSTMGAIFKINIYYIEDYSELGVLRDKGFKLVLADMDGSVKYYNEDLRGRIILTVGNEGNGVSSSFYGFPSVKVYIPMSNDLESLNVAQALSIIAFEHVRQMDNL